MPPFSPRHRPMPPFSFPHGPGRNPFPRNMPRRQPKSGGLLARLLNRNSIPAARTGFERLGANAAGAAAQQGAASTLTFKEMLTNTQQVLQTINQAGPIMQQYAPLVKNLPSMWNLYKGLKSLPDLEAVESADNLDESMESYSDLNIDESSTGYESAESDENYKNERKPSNNTVRKKNSGSKKTKKGKKKSKPSKSKSSNSKKSAHSKPKLYL